jgi:hypothetical protein
LKRTAWSNSRELIGRKQTNAPSAANPPTWSDGAFIRACALRFARGDDSAWREFLERIHLDRRLALSIRLILIDRGVVREVSKHDTEVESSPPFTVQAMLAETSKLLGEMPGVSSGRPSPNAT